MRYVDCGVDISGRLEPFEAFKYFMEVRQMWSIFKALIFFVWTQIRNIKVR